MEKGKKQGIKQALNFRDDRILREQLLTAEKKLLATFTFRAIFQKDRLCPNQATKGTYLSLFGKFFWVQP